MPTRTIILAATPRCGTRRMDRDGQHGVHYTCDALLRWDHDGLQWCCTDASCTQHVTRNYPKRATAA